MNILKDILVVSVEQAVAVPYCTARLNHSGARVIKIERESGDFARRYDAAAKGDSSYFAWINLGKESAVIDFKTAEGAKLLHNIISKADVFIQNLAPGAMARAGFGETELRKKYPRLITCNLTGYGSDEKVRHLKAYDLLVQGESGLLNLTGSENDIGRIGISICDIGAGMTAYTAILEALIQRRQTGEGDHINVSLFDVAAEWMTVPVIHEMYGNGAPKRQGINHPSIAPYGAYATRDGIETIISIQNEHEWLNFCRFVLQNESVATQPEFQTNNDRVANRQALNEVINNVTGNLTADELKDRLIAGKIAFGGINTVRQVVNHDAMRFRQIQNSQGHELDIPAHPILHSADSDAKYSKDNRKAPAVGEHTEKIIKEFSAPD